MPLKFSLRPGEKVIVNGAVIGSWAAHVPFAQARIGGSTGTLGLCLLALAGGALIAMPITGQLLDRRSSAGLVRIGGIVEPLLLMVPLLAFSPVTLGLALLALGLANGLLDVSMNAHGAALERTRAHPIMSSLHAGWSLGGLTGAGLAAIGNAFGADPRAQLVVVGVVLLAIGFACGPRLGEATAQTIAAPAFASTTPDAGRDASSASASSRTRLQPRAARPPRTRLRAAVPPRPALLLGALAVVLFMAEGAMGDWSALYLHRDLTLSASFAAAGYAAFQAGMTIGRLSGDAVNRALGASRLLRGGTALAAIAFGTLLALAEPALALPALALTGLGLSNGVPLLFSAAGRVRGIAPGPAQAAVSTMGYGGLLVGPPLLGLLANATSLPIALGLSAALVGLVSLLAGQVAGGVLHTHGSRAARQPDTVAA